MDGRVVVRPDPGFVAPGADREDRRAKAHPEAGDGREDEQQEEVRSWEARPARSRIETRRRGLRHRRGLLMEPAVLAAPILRRANLGRPLFSGGWTHERGPGQSLKTASSRRT